MLIYILHSDKYYTFKLPKEINGSYILTDYDQDRHLRNLTNIIGIDGKWYINSNEDIIVNYNGKDVERIQLVQYCFYSIKIFKKESIIIYVAPGYEKNISVKSILDDTSLILGKSNSCDLIYMSNNVADKQVELKYENGKFLYKNLYPQIPIYVNKKRNDESCINTFDSIFIMGLRLIVFNNKIIIVGNLSLLQSYSKALVDEKPNYDKADIIVEENIKDFYSFSDYFSKSPVFSKKYDEFVVTITPPNEKKTDDGSSMLFQIIPSALMSVTSIISTYYAIQNYNSGNGDRESLITSLLMSAVMLLTGIIWPIVEIIASKIKVFLSNRIRVHDYKRYLKKKRNELDKVIDNEKMTLEFNSLPLISCQDAILKKHSYLFSKSIDTSSFLTIKLGVGKIKSSIKFDYFKPDLIVENDKLLKEIDKLIEEYKYIDNVPFTFSLKENNSLAVINNKGNYDNYINSLILQLITLHDYQSLKIVVFTNENSNLLKIRNINHCWSDDRNFRYFAENSNEADNVSSELVRIFNSYLKISKGDSDIKTNYVIITDSIEQYKNLKIIEKILETKEYNGFSVIMFSSKLVNIPIGCKNFIDYSGTMASFFKSEMNENSLIKFKPELITNDIDFYRCIDEISNIPIKMDNEVKGSLPEKLGFLEMYNVGNILQLNILNRWRTSTIVNSLAVPIGVDSNTNILYLDLHEKKHGPHGLIAGMTGSGKSEFIVTYILSLSICFSPDEVQFVLIDYKGGGLAGAFENRKTGVKLPHLAGTITNLDKSEMNRTLVSIKSELQRRQKKFNEVKENLGTGNLDIYKYQGLVRDGLIKEPMSHLFIICDEFAELKAQQPEFMDELVSAARIGRSLGIHLILATQKPSGVVDDQIWSNSKFKVCCKVQTADDSEEMIRKPDAAYIKEAGRFYLQVGYDEYYVLGQSGYSGVQYVPSEQVISKLDDSVSFINNIGDIYKNVTNRKGSQIGENPQKYGEELNEILRYIVDIAQRNNYVSHQLWLDNVPKILMYTNLIKKYSNYSVKPFDINPLVGEYDDPKNQTQGYVSIPITTGGNTMIIGSTGMGKTTLLSTIIYSTIINHRQNEVNFYIIDLLGEKLRKFSRAPHVGDVIGISDSKKINYLFYMIEAEIYKRQRYYVQNGGDFASDVRNGKSVFSNIVVILHGLDVFRETYSELHDEKLGSITRNCSKYGIYFVISVSTTSGISYSIESNINQFYMLNLNDTGEYENYFESGIIPSKNPGRGLMKINGETLEFQTALSVEEDKEKMAIDFVISKLIEIFPKKAKEIPFVPKKLTYSKLKEEITNIEMVPIGINEITAQYSYFDFSRKVSLISSSENEILKKIMPNFIKTLSLCKNNKVIVLNTVDEIQFIEDNNVKIYNSNFKNVFSIIKNAIEKTINSESSYTIVIIGYAKLNRHMQKLKEEDERINTIDDIIINSNINNNFKFIIYEKSEFFSNVLNSKISDFIDNQSGLWIGVDYEAQDSIQVENSYTDVSLSKDTIVVVNDSVPEFVKYPTIN